MMDLGATNKKPMELGNKCGNMKKPGESKKSLVPQQEEPQECVGGSFKKDGRAGGTSRRPGKNGKLS